MGVGRRLRQARESRGISTSEVAARTKIPGWQLTALEAEEYERLPGGIFVKGHIRATAKVVGLDPVELSAEFDEEMRPPPLARGQMPDVDDGQPRLRMAADLPAPPPRPTGRLLAAWLIVISIVLAIAWFGRDRESPPASRQDTAPPAQAARGPTDSGGPASVGTMGVRPTPVPQSGVPVSLEAQRVCWVALTVDDERVAYRVLRRGEKVSAHMRRRATLRTGDAGALLISIGKGPAKPLGVRGVRTIELTSEDYARADAR
jgi:cytoskeletal protein RodZ